MTPHLKRNSVLGGLARGRAGVPGHREGTWRKDAGPSRLSARPIRGGGGGLGPRPHPDAPQTNGENFRARCTENVIIL